MPVTSPSTSRLTDVLEPIKETPEAALSDAMEVLAQARKPLSVRDFLHAMQARSVTISAAQDAIRALIYQGRLDVTQLGDLELRAP